MPEYNLAKKIKGCIIGSAAGSLYGRFVEHSAWRKTFAERMAAAEEFPKKAGGMAWGAHGVDYNSHMLLISDAFIAKQGTPTVEETAAKWLKNVDPLRFGDGDITIKPVANPIKYAMRNSYELLSSGAPPRIAGALNVPTNTGLYVCAPSAAANACDPDQAFLDAVSLASLFQRDRGAVVPGIVAAMTAEAMKQDRTIEDTAETADRLAGDVAARNTKTGRTDPIHYLVSEARRNSRNAENAEALYRRFGKMTEPSSKRDPHKMLIQTTAITLFAGGNAEKAVKTAVLDAQSPDFLGACCGMICGALEGIDAFPSSWIEMVESLPNGRDFGETADRLTELLIAGAEKKNRIAEKILSMG